MTMTELICKKRDGGRLSTEEINFMVQGYTRGEIPDYQMAAMCMAIYFSGMDDDETLDLTMAMLDSGDRLDLSAIDGIKADKHSTGGVGDKTSLVLCPMLAACGVKVAKMSGRGLGHTGGTTDKLESFPGLRVELSEAEIIANVQKSGLCIAGQTGDIAPADKLLYALRDVTGTVPSMPLIISSIMSKKLATGEDIIILDVKTGSGAFMKTEEDAKALARGLVRIGRLAGKRCGAVITDMDQPLGYTVGNALEVREAIETLKGKCRNELLELCVTIGACILTEAGLAADKAEAEAMLLQSVTDGTALKKLAEMVENQYGDAKAVYDTSRLPQAKVKRELISDVSGYVTHIMAEEVGLVSMHLGGGRQTKDSVIDLSVGLELHRKVGDHVGAGESLATIHASSASAAEKAAAELRACYCIEENAPAMKAFIKEIIL